jgi:hypothetical protein
MQSIDEWQRVFPLSDAAERESKRNDAVGAIASARKLPKLRSEDFAPNLEAVGAERAHFYCAEGYPWIKVSFAVPDASTLMQKFVKAGRAIQDASGPVQVYFHALRRNDILFFLNRSVAYTKNDAELMPKSFGVPLESAAEADNEARPS